MIPLRDLRPLSDGTTHWQATGCDPQFSIPCALPAGWVRIRVRLHSNVRGRMEWYTVDSAGLSSEMPIERRDYVGAAGWDFFVRLPHPVSGFRFDPLDVEGRFVVEELHVEPLSAIGVFARALSRKLGLLVRHRRLWSAVRNGLQMALRGDWITVRTKLFGGLPRPAFQTTPSTASEKLYERWRQVRQSIPTLSMEAMCLSSEGPLLSLILPIPSGSDSRVEETIASVLHQRYHHWRLVLVAHQADAMDPWVEDSRIRAVPSRAVLEDLAGHAFGFLDVGDLLHEEALLRVAHAFTNDPNLDMVYSDEDRILEDGRHGEPVFKPAWSPELLLSTPYTGRLCFYRSGLVRRLGGFHHRVDGDEELTQRFAQTDARVGHIPDVLYHRRRGKPRPAKPIRFPVDGCPRVSILIPSAYTATAVAGRETTLLRRCLESIRVQTTYPHYEIMVAGNGQPPAELRPLFSELGVRSLTYELPFNWAAAMNQAAAIATGDYLLFLDDDTEVITLDWLERLLEFGQQQGIGAVGARLLFPDGRLQHAGVALLNGHAVHPFAGMPGDCPGYLGTTLWPRNFSAVTSACMLTPTDLFRMVGGFRESFAVYYNDIDYCLRLTERGWRIVYTPYASLRHHEAATKTAMRPVEQRIFQELWGGRLWNDPYYNPNLSATSRDYRIETDPELIRRTARAVRYGYLPGLHHAQSVVIS